MSSEPREGTEFQRFRNLARRVIRVPKAEAQALARKGKSVKKPPGTNKRSPPAVS